MAWSKVITNGGALGTPASGDGSNLTAINGTQITSGTVVSARLDSDTAHLSGTQTFSGAKTFSTSPFVDTSSGLTLSLKSTHAQGGYLRLMKDGATECYLGRRGAVSGTGGTGYDLYTVAGHDLKFFPAGSLALTLDTSQNATFTGDVDVKRLKVNGSWAFEDVGSSTLRIGEDFGTLQHYGDSTFVGTVTAPTFIGALTGNASGSSATCSGNAATSTKISSITNSNIVQLTSSQTLTNKSISYGQITSAPWTTNTGTVTSVTTSGTVSGITLTGSVTTSGALTLGGSIGIDDLDNVTVSDSAASGSPSTGDIWIEY